MKLILYDCLISFRFKCNWKIELFSFLNTFQDFVFIYLKNINSSPKFDFHSSGDADRTVDGYGGARVWGSRQTHRQPRGHARQGRVRSCDRQWRHPRPEVRDRAGHVDSEDLAYAVSRVRNRVARVTRVSASRKVHASG